MVDSVCLIEMVRALVGSMVVSSCSPLPVELQLDSTVAVRMMDSNWLESVLDSACLYRLEHVQACRLIVERG